MASGFAQWGNDLYTGRRSYAIVAKRRAYFVVALVLVVLSSASSGSGSPVTGSTSASSSAAGRSSPSPASPTPRSSPRRRRRGGRPEEVPRVTSVGSSTVRVQTAELSNAQVEQVAVELASAYDVSEGR